MKTIPKQKLFGANDLKVTDVPLPDEYGKGFKLQVRKMTVPERSDCEVRYMEGKKATQDPKAFKWFIIKLTTIDEDGKPYFEEADRDQFMAKSSDLGELLFTASCELNNLTESNVSDTAKNLEIAPV